MTGLGALIRRNCKLFFKDKGMFFTSLITPVILLVLYATFLAKVYRDSFAAAMLYATLHGFGVEKTLDYAMAAGIAAVSHERTINPNMSTAMLEEILLAHRI